MRILVITPYFFPHPGGSQNYIEELYSTLIRLYKDIKVDVITYNTDSATKFEKYKGLRVYRVGCVEVLRGQLAIPNYIALLSLVRKLKKNSYDVVNSHTRFFENSWWAPWIAKYLGAKSVLTDHCANHPVHPNKAVSLMAAVVDMVVMRVFARFYNQTTVVCKATGEFDRKLGLKDYEVVYGGVSSHDFKPAQNKLDTNKTLRVGYVGRMIPAKGITQLYEVISKLVDEGKDLEMFFGGDGVEYERLLKKNLNPKIHLLGRLDRRGVISLLQTMDVFVYPSYHHEGFPIALLEAGAAGCVVIASDVGGVSELVEDKKTGLLIRPKDWNKLAWALRWVYDNRVDAKVMATKLRDKVVARFDWEVIVKDYYRLLTKIVESK